MTPTDLATARMALGGKVALWAGPELGGKGDRSSRARRREVDSAVGRPIRGEALELTYGAGGFGPCRHDSIDFGQIRADDPAQSYIEAASTTHKDSPISSLGSRAATSNPR
jgi:hypothetical protein